MHDVLYIYFIYIYIKTILRKRIDLLRGKIVFSVIGFFV